MNKVFLGLLGLFAVLYVAAQLTLTSPERPGVVRVRWATDPNPARGKQTEAFARLNPGVIVTVDPGDRQKLLVQCAAGWGPDVIDCYDTGNMQMFVEAGVLLDLTDLARQHGFSPEATYPALRDCLTVEGRQYRFPCNVWANCVVYNRDLFQQLNVAPPKEGWTYDDLVRVGRQIHQAGGGKVLPVANWNSFWLLKDMYIGAGGTFFKPGSHGLICNLDSPEAQAVMRFYHDMMHVHRILPTPAETIALSSQGGWGGGSLTWFATEKAAMVFIGRWFIVSVPNYKGLGDKLAVARLPSWPGRPSQGMCDTRAAGINLKSQHRDEAVKFLKYLAGEEYGRVIVADGDGLPPNPELARSGEGLVNDLVGDPAFHQPFVDAIRDARPVDISPFIDAGMVDRWLSERIGQVENRQVEPEAAMKSLAEEVNRQIRANLEDRPDLQDKYTRLTGQAYSRDWWHR